MQTQQIETLRARYIEGAEGTEWARDFAASIVTQYARKGTLSEKQWHWVAKLATETTRPEPKRETIGSMAGVYELLIKARTYIKWPKIRLQLGDGTPVALGLSGSRSKHPDTINVTDGGPFDENRWWGRIARDGEWTQPLNGVPAELAELLTQLGNEPAETAAAYGRLTGNCCFCSRALDTDESTAVGYGPICAKHFGLPWGKVAARDAKAAREQ